MSPGRFDAIRREIGLIMGWKAQSYTARRFAEDLNPNCTRGWCRSLQTATRTASNASSLVAASHRRTGADGQDRGK